MKRRGGKKEKKNLKLSTLVSLGVTDQSLPLCFQIVFLGATVFTGKNSEVYFLLHSYLITPQKHLCVHGAPPSPHQLRLTTSALRLWLRRPLYYRPAQLPRGLVFKLLPVTPTYSS